MTETALVFGMAVSGEAVARALHDRGFRVLVADDHPLNQKVAVQLLEKLGCRVDVVSDGADAVNAIRQTPYHLVLMEGRLPSLDGADATRAIRTLTLEGRLRRPRTLPRIAYATFSPSSPAVATWYSKGWNR